MMDRGGGTGPAAAGPIIYSETTRTKDYHKNKNNVLILFKIFKIHFL